MNSRIPVHLEWEDDSGQTSRARGYTRVIGHYGCLVVLPQALAKNQRIQLTNSATEEVNPAVVVWQGKQGGEGWELGVELTQPPVGFWGLEV